jgi:predicted amidohydrolase YtcJ
MPSADLVLKNARVITMDSTRPAVALVAVTGDTISYVGEQAELESLTGLGTRVIDCNDRAVLPGFNDAHLHLFSLVRKLLGIDLSPALVRSIEDIKEKIREKARNTPPGTWLSGTDFNEFYLKEKRYPTRRDLDEAAPNHPVILSHRSLHACVLNSPALALAGITRETEEPPGARIERDPATGEPNGVLYEMLGYIRSQVMPPFSVAEMAEGIALADHNLISCGITSIQEATISNDLKRWQTIGELKQAGRLHSRVRMMAGAPARRQFEATGLKTGSGDYRMGLGAVKVMVTKATGELNPPFEELKQLALESHQAGFQLAFHAEEEEVVAAVIETLEYIDRHSPVVGRRHRIEHCSECPPYLLERLKKLGVVIISHPASLYYNGERYLATVPESQLPWLYRIRSPLESGLIVAAASDAPVMPVNPLVGICGAVTRKAESGQVLLPEECITVEQALSLYTTGAAYASFEENIKGSITPGKLADMVVLSDDPTRVPPEKIKDIKVEMTIIGGEVVWEA